MTLPKEKKVTGQLEWVCMVVHTGFHNGAGCSPEEPHGDDWECGWHCHALIPVTTDVLVIGQCIARFDGRRITSLTFTPSLNGDIEVVEGDDEVDTRVFWPAMQDFLEKGEVTWTE